MNLASLKEDVSRNGPGFRGGRRLVQQTDAMRPHARHTNPNSPAKADLGEKHLQHEREHYPACAGPGYRDAGRRGTEANKVRLRGAHARIKANQKCSDTALRRGIDAGDSHEARADAEQDSLGQDELVVLDAKRCHHEAERGEDSPEQDQTLGSVRIEEAPDEQALSAPKISIQARQNREMRRTEKKNDHSCKEPIQEMSEGE
jgi:hypothetical protein